MELYIGVIVAVIFLAITFWIIKRKRRMSLFQRYGIPSVKPNFWTGNLKEYIEKREYCTLEWTKKYGKFVGFYFGAKPMLIAYDINFLKTIQAKEFQKFSNKDMILPDGGIPHKSLQSYVEMLDNEDWKNVRSCLSAALSTGKLRRIFPIFIHTKDIFMKNIQKEDCQPFDILNFFKKLTFDTISKSFFGVTTDVQNNNTNKFIESVYDVFDIDSSDILATISVCFPEFEPLPTKLRSFIDACRYQMNKTSVRCLANTCKNIIESRKKMKLPPSDLLQSMIDANEDQVISSSSEQNVVKDKNSYGKLHKMTDEEVLGNTIGFMVAGYHTTSSTLGYCAYFLSKNPDIQEKVREEINKHFKSEEEIDYSGLANLQYMDQVISETLRLFPLTLQTINRVCKEDFKYQGMVVPKGAIVVVPVWALHRDPEYWTEPEKFIPERFSPENRGSIDPFLYQPFGTGPRICIGMRLANLTMKYILANLLRAYKLESCEEGKELELDYTLFFINARNGIHVRAIPV